MVDKRGEVACSRPVPHGLREVVAHAFEVLKWHSARDAWKGEARGAVAGHIQDGVDERVAIRSGEAGKLHLRGHDCEFGSAQPGATKQGLQPTALGLGYLGATRPVGRNSQQRLGGRDLAQQVVHPARATATARTRGVKKGAG